MSGHKAKVCYLHIGAEKTGSTSLQAFLRDNRDMLLRHGVLFPKSPGADNQPALAAYAMGDCSRGRLLAQVGVKSETDLAEFKAGLEASLASEVADAGVDTLVLTNEHCHSRIETREELERLAALLDSVAETVRVIFYIRRQDLAATSLYSTALKVGQGRKRPEMQVSDPPPFAFDYWRTCELFSDVFGAEAMDVRLFGKTSFSGGDLLTDFCQAICVPEDANWRRPSSQNQSINRLAQRFLAAFNRNRQERFGPDAENYRMALVRMLDRHFGGKGIKPPRRRAKDFLAQFSESNEALRQAFFPDHTAPLFGDDFSMYPEEEKDWQPGLFMAFDIGARLFVEQQKEIERLRAENEELHNRQRN